MINKKSIVVVPALLAAIVLGSAAGPALSLADQGRGRGGDDFRREFRGDFRKDRHDFGFRRQVVLKREAPRFKKVVHRNVFDDKKFFKPEKRFFNFDHRAGAHY